MSSWSNKGVGSGARPESKSRKGLESTGKKIEEEREETLQAVILADSFENRFRPLTLRTPRCLLPVANTPLIDYTLEFLAMSGVANVYIYCGAFTGSVESYLHSSKWHPSASASPFQTLESIKTTASSIGDVMRDLDARDLITGDFLLVYGDLISNLPIGDVLAKHQARKTADKNAIMTMILRSGGLGSHRTKNQGVVPVFVVDPRTDQCLHYEEMSPLQANRYVNIDPDLLKAHTEMEIRTDLIDCGIDICTPEVLALWSESFDYEVTRRHFLHGVLKDYQLNGKTIHTEIIDHHYAARVSNLQLYEAISRDVQGRWTYPLVPDSNLVPDQTYKVERGGLCKENGVILARTCKTEKRTILGQNTSIGEYSEVANSIIGRRCQIGQRVRIQNAFIWDDVVIGDGTTIDHAIIASHSTIGQNCKIRTGAIISFGVEILDNQEIEAGQKMTSTHEASVASGDLPDKKDSPSIMTEKGLNLLCDDDSDYDEAAIFNSTLIYSTAHLNLSSSSISTFTSTLSDDSVPRSGMRHASFTSMASDSDQVWGNETFHHDAVNGLLDTLRENGDFDSAKLEFMGLRLSNDATDHQIRRAIAVAFTKRITQLVENDKLEALKAATSAFDTSGAEKFLKEVAIGLEKRLIDQVDFISCLQKDLVHRVGGATILAAVSQSLYTRDVLEEDAFLSWWEQSEQLGSAESDEMVKVREKTGVFIEWLREADSESSDDDDDDNDDDERQ